LEYCMTIGEATYREVIIMLHVTSGNKRRKFTRALGMFMDRMFIKLFVFWAGW